MKSGRKKSCEIASIKTSFNLKKIIYRAGCQLEEDPPRWGPTQLRRIRRGRVDGTSHRGGASVVGELLGQFELILKDVKVGDIYILHR